MLIMARSAAIAKESERQDPHPPPLQHAVKNNWGSLAGGLLLQGSGVYLTIGLRKKKALIPGR
jgi:hypothetical protein